jgi:hypothetical protein
VFDVARFDWKIAAGTVVFSDLEQLRAAASSGKYDLVAEKLANGRDSHIALLNRQCWGSGAGSNDIDGIQKLISDHADDRHGRRDQPRDVHVLALAATAGEDHDQLRQPPLVAADGGTSARSAA